MTRRFQFRTSVFVSGTLFLLPLPFVLGAKPASPQLEKTDGCPATPVQLQTTETKPAAEATKAKQLVIKYGATVTAESGAKVKFKQLQGDSRCPKNVDCIWAGNAKVVLEVTEPNTKPVEFELNTGLEPREKQIGRTSYKIAALTPYPEAGKTFPVEQYELTLELGAVE